MNRATARVSAGRFLRLACARIRVLSIEALLLLVALAMVFNGLATFLQGVYGGSHSTPFRDAVVALGRTTFLLGLLSLLVMLGIVWWRHGGFRPPSAPPGHAIVRRALLLSVIGWLLLMLIPPFVALSRNPYHGVTWLAWGLQDYRWLISGYLLTISAVVALPPLAGRCLPGPPASRTRPPAPVRGVSGGRLAGVIVSAAVALALFAPPWHIERTTGEVGNHDVHLSQLQAIRMGSVPYVGPASIQYGPGSQLLQYGYMTVSGRFSLLGYRESYGLSMMLAFATFTAIAVGAFGIRTGTLAALFALYLSPFAMFGWAGTILVGFMGWGNAFRYLGTLFVLALLPALLRRGRGWWNGPAVVVGLGWGFFCWMSQENLAMTVIAAGLFLLANWALDGCSFQQIRGVVLNCVAGWMVFWAPILAWYAFVGELSRFVESYSLVSRMVAAGMSNTPWDPAMNVGWTAAFYLTPVVLAAAAWSSIFDWRSRGFSVPLTPERQALLAVACAGLVSYTGALLRKDSSHLLNVLTALPLVLAALAVLVANDEAPLWSRLLRLVALAAFVAQFPAAPRLLQFPQELIASPLGRFNVAPQPSTWRHEPGVAFARAGSFVDGNYRIYEGAASARLFLQEMNGVHAQLRDRPVYVHSFPNVPPELVYFFADLKPGPILFNVSTMVFNTEVQKRFLQHMDEHCAAFGAMIAADPSAAEVGIFRRCHPGAIELRRTIADQPYFIWLNEPSTPASATPLVQHPRHVIH